MYCKAGKVVLQSKESVTRSSNFYYKLRQVSQSGATFITMMDRYYKVKGIITK